MGSHFKQDFLASIVVFLVALPLCMGIAIASDGVPVAAGLITGIVGGIVVGSLASELGKVPARSELHVDFQYLDYIDHACLDLLMTWA